MRKFDFEERYNILEKGFYVYYQKGTNIFHQGDIGDYMYIILKGAVGIRVTDTAKDFKPLIIATLREGEQFGELALIKNVIYQMKWRLLNTGRCFL